eukprot:6185175-Pleurochrysis_carterae.AAC.8
MAVLVTYQRAHSIQQRISSRAVNAYGYIDASQATRGVRVAVKIFPGAQGVIEFESYRTWRRVEVKFDSLSNMEAILFFSQLY